MFPYFGVINTVNLFMTVDEATDRDSYQSIQNSKYFITYRMKWETEENNTNIKSAMKSRFDPFSAISKINIKLRNNLSHTRWKYTCLRWFAPFSIKISNHNPVVSLKIVVFKYFANEYDIITTLNERINEDIFR